MIRVLLWVALFLFAAANCFAGHYTGRTVSVVTSYSAGSESDIQSRIFAEALERYLGTTVVVESKPGGNLRNAPNFVVTNAGTEGTRIGFLSGMFSSYVVDPRGYLLNPREFKYLATMGNGHVYVVSTRVGKSLAEVVAASHKRKLFVAGLGDTNARDITASIHLSMLGIEHEFVNYKGEAETVPRLMSGELDIVSVIANRWRSFADTEVANGRAIPLFSQNLDYTPRMTNGDPVKDTTQLVAAGNGIQARTARALSAISRVMSTTVLMPPSTPDAALFEMNKAVQAVFKDKDYLRRTEVEPGINLHCTCGYRAASAAVAEHGTLPPDVAAYLAQLVKEKSAH
jgi:hypothetical protein